jgi:hypothetical protein
MGDITTDVQPPVKIVGYADDWTISMRGRDMETIHQELQNTVDKVRQWAKLGGFRFSTSKTVTMHFTRLRPSTYALPTLTITLHGKTLQRVHQQKILGLIFDEKLEWKKQIEYVQRKCVKRLNLARCLARLKWGADQDVLL